MKFSIPILHEDEQLLVINKPAGLLSVPDRYDEDLPWLGKLLTPKYGKLFTVHRLDRDTSGAMVFAKDADTHKTLSQAFEAREVDKLYHALVDGVPMKDSGTIDRPIAPHPGKPGRMIMSARGKAALSHYRVLKSFGHFSLMEVRIETGRTHQVRLHMQAIGHPLMVDPFYGRREAFFLSEIKKRRYNLGKHQEERPLLSRASLHAFALSFTHPKSGEELTIQGPYPKDLRAVLAQLEKWDK